MTAAVIPQCPKTTLLVRFSRSLAHMLHSFAFMTLISCCISIININHDPSTSIFPHLSAIQCLPVYVEISQHPFNDRKAINIPTLNVRVFVLGSKSFLCFFQKNWFIFHMIIKKNLFIAIMRMSLFSIFRQPSFGR